MVVTLESLFFNKKRQVSSEKRTVLDNTFQQKKEKEKKRHKTV